MKHRIWIPGLLVGAVFGLIVSSVLTILDWRLNPGGIFHNAQGTNWNVVSDTVVSWFLPTFGLASVVAILVFLWRERRK